MPEDPETLHQLGAFDPHEAKKVLALLEAQQIAFEVEADHSALIEPQRAVQLYLGMYPEGSKMAVFIREADLQKALKLIEDHFPV